MQNRNCHLRSANGRRAAAGLQKDRPLPRGSAIVSYPKEQAARACFVVCSMLQSAKALKACQAKGRQSTRH